MDGEKLKKLIGHNIAMYRKRARMTQAGLAEKLNYSDKAVSKWERGESVPDVLTLAQIAEQFGICVDDLLLDPNVLPEHTGKVQHAMEKVVERTLKRKANKNIILGLSSILVWFVAMLLYVIISSLDVPYSWLAFIYAVPANAIVLLSLRSAWRDFRWNRALISAIMWGGLLSLFITMLILANINVWKVFLLGALGQLAILLWFRLFRYEKNEEASNGQEAAAQCCPPAETGDDES